jgi:hypothetical protein
VSGGVAAILDGDTPRSLLARADAALYSAKEAGRNRTYRHTGNNLQPLPAQHANGKQNDLDAKPEERLNRRPTDVMPASRRGGEARRQDLLPARTMEPEPVAHASV